MLKLIAQAQGDSKERFGIAKKLFIDRLIIEMNCAWSGVWTLTIPKRSAIVTVKQIGVCYSRKDTERAD